MFDNIKGLTISPMFDNNPDRNGANKRNTLTPNTHRKITPARVSYYEKR